MAQKNREYVGTLKEMSSNGALADGTAFDDYVVPGTNGLKPRDEQHPLPAWRITEFQNDWQEVKRRREGDQTAKEACTENYENVDVLMKAMENRVEALRMTNPDMPATLCLTSKQMAFLKTDQQIWLDRLSAFENVVEADVPEDGAMFLGKKK